MEIPRGSNSSSEVVSNYSLDNEQKQEHFRSVLFFVFFYESFIFFFRAEKKISKKVAGDYYRGCVPGLKPWVAIINCSPLWLQTVHRTVCGARRACNALRSTRKINARFIIAGTFFPDRPNKTAAGASLRFERCGRLLCKNGRKIRVFAGFSKFFRHKC